MSNKTQQIRERAYQIWHEQGQPEGLATDHWLQAERELNEGGSDSASEGEGSQTGAREYNEGGRDAVKALDDPSEATEMKKEHSHGEDLALKQ